MAATNLDPEGKGTPAAMSTTTSSPPARSPGPDAPCLGKGDRDRRDCVLIVDDNPINRTLGEAQFVTLGYEVRTAAHGEDAIARCLENPPGLVLMDIEMPVLDGIETTSRLRALQAVGWLPFFPILAWTSNRSDAVRRDCVSAGMNGVFAKPLEFRQIASEVQRLLPRAAATG